MTAIYYTSSEATSRMMRGRIVNAPAEAREAAKRGERPIVQTNHGPKIMIHRDGKFYGREVAK